MSIVAAIPLRSLATGKQRLRHYFSDDGRQSLIFTLCLRSINAVIESGMCDHILLISQDAPLLEWMSQTVPGIIPLLQRSEGLISALWQGNNEALRRGATTYCTLHADLPLLTVASVNQLLTPLTENDDPTVVIAGDRFHTGTNALVVRPLGAIPFRFGENSFARHIDAATSQHMNTIISTDVLLECDLDVPADVAYLEQNHAELWHDLLAEADTWRTTAQTIVSTSR